MTKAVLFDVDGTLIDTVDLHANAWVEALRHFGVHSSFEDMRLQIGKGGDQVLLGLLPPAELERKGEEIQAFRSDLFKRKYLPEARAFPGVRELFQRIRASGRRIVLASSRLQPATALGIDQRKVRIGGCAAIAASAPLTSAFRQWAKVRCWRTADPRRKRNVGFGADIV